jgi:hypothetical protein
LLLEASILLPEAIISFSGIKPCLGPHARLAGDVVKSPILRAAVSTQRRFVPPKKMSLSPPSRRALSGSLPCQIPQMRLPACVQITELHLSHNRLRVPSSNICIHIRLPRHPVLQGCSAPAAPPFVCRGGLP